MQSVTPAIEAQHSSARAALEQNPRPDRRIPALHDTPAERHLPQLLAAALAARSRAYAPYSNFAVGAALLDEQGRIHAGCNVENAAYPEGLCAEAVALGLLVTAGGTRVLAALVAADSPAAVTPCGGCRQKLREFATPDTPVWSANTRAVVARLSLGELLPVSFGPDHLGPR
jgi:cytidine deaminase